MVTDSFLKDPIRVLIHSDSAHKNFLSIKCLPKVAKDSNYKGRLQCSFDISLVLHGPPYNSARQKPVTSGGKPHLGAILLSNPIYLNFGGKCKGANSPKVWPGKAIKTVPTSPRFGSCKVTSFDKNAGQIRTQMSSH